MKKLKYILVILLISVLIFIGFNILARREFIPVTLADLQQMEINAQQSEFGIAIIRWSKDAKIYHIWSQCPVLAGVKESELQEGLVKAAFEEGRVRLCYFCAEHFDIVDGVQERK